MKYTLFIYFYNHILDLIIYVSNSLAASTWSYGTWFSKKLRFINQRPHCNTQRCNPLWDEGVLLPWVSDLISEIIPKNIPESLGPAQSRLVERLGRGFGVCSSLRRLSQSGGCCVVFFLSTLDDEETETHPGRSEENLDLVAFNHLPKKTSLLLFLSPSSSFPSPWSKPSQTRALNALTQIKPNSVFYSFCFWWNA